MMILLEENQLISKKVKKDIKNRLTINTLIPNFQFKNKLGNWIKPINRSVTL